ncbi:hypothetical protein BSKO_01873 [Bryopsis sp. KO-2023]|nr:hypothetical protein BSKO_01873 [Bryopsis sp. KO-2023]
MGEASGLGKDNVAVPKPQRIRITPVQFEDWNEDGKSGPEEYKPLIWCSTQQACYEKIDKMNSGDAVTESGARGSKRPRYFAFSQEITFAGNKRKAVGRDVDGKPSGTPFGYVVATYQSMAEESKRQEMPSYYEMVREGYPCHLYFDLEYEKEQNEDLDGCRMVEELVAKLDGFLRKWLGLTLADSFILELDSTTDIKFSRHLVIRLPNHAFKDNSHVKVLVNTFLETLGRDELKVKSKDGKTCAHFVDRSVYSRNRNFRMMYNTKAGRNAKLLPTKRFSMATVTTLTASSYRKLFHLGLICSVKEGVQLYDMSTYQGFVEKKDHKIVSLQERRGGIGNTKKFVGSRALNEVPVKCDKDVVLEEKFVKAIRGLIPYMEKIAKRRSGQHASVNSIMVLGSCCELVSYAFLGNGSHYCENIGRNHAKNHIHLLVNLTSRDYCQKCFDADCAGFSSEWRPLIQSKKK